MSEAAAMEGLEQNRSGGLVASGVRFLRAFAVHAGRTGVLGAVLVCASALLENVGLVLLVPFLSVAMDQAAPGAWMERLAAPLFQFFHVETRLSRLSVLLGLFAALLLLRAAVNMARGRVLARLRIGFVEERRSHLLRALARTPWERVLSLRHARVTQVINGDMMQLGAASYFLLEGGVAALMLASQCATAFLLAPAFAAISLVLLAAAALAARPLLRRGYALGASISNDNLALNHALGQFLGGLKIAIGQNLQAGFVAEFESAAADLRSRQTQFQLQQTDSQIALSTLSGCVGCLCALIGLGVMDMPAPVVFTLLLVLARISGPAQLIIRGAQHFAHSLPAFERACELEADLAPAAALDEPAVPLDADGTIDFRGVTFLHGGATGGVRDLTLSIARGEIIGVTGPSGAGKTTFADLLVGLIAPRSGSIRVGGTPLSGGALTAWRGAVGYVAQDPFLFHDTIRRNLLWANPAAGEAELWAALERVGAADLARRAPEGLDAIVGERGGLLSGGERQRVALARALLRKPRLLVLDEATSAMDIASEQIALDGLLTIDPAPTIVIIAHRGESLRPCGRVLRFEADGLARAD